MLRSTVFTPVVAIAIMVFFALCSQCMATLVTIAREQVAGQDREDVVAVDGSTRVIDQEDAVGVAVEGDPELGTVLDRRRGDRLEVRGAAVDVDVRAVRLAGDQLRVGAECGEQTRGDRRGRAVGAVHDDAQSVELDACRDRKSTRLNSSHMSESRMPSSA